MKTQRILSSLSFAVVTFGVLSLLAFGIGRADTAWVDELSNSLHFYQINYPTSNWEPYSHKLDVVKQAVAGGSTDRQIRNGKMVQDASRPRPWDQ